MKKGGAYDRSIRAFSVVYALIGVVILACLTLYYYLKRIDWL